MFVEGMTAEPDAILSQHPLTCNSSLTVHWIVNKSVKLGELPHISHCLPHCCSLCKFEFELGSVDFFGAAK